MEVELEWLTPESKKGAPKKGPPPIPGAQVHMPPMPVKASLPSMPAASKELLKPRPMGKPIPREEEDHEPPQRKHSRPPPLPPRKKP